MTAEIRKNTPDDYELAYTLTRELMVHHNALDIFTTTPERLKELIGSGMLQSYTLYCDGKPAGIMNFFYKLAPHLTSKIITKILKKSGLKIFEDMQ